MYRTDIKKSLLSATSIVLKTIRKEMPFKEFVKEYDNFYHYEALDGHEADEIHKKVLDEFKIAIQLHEKIQMQVIDQLYLEETNKGQYMEVGRIDEHEAIRRLAEIGIMFDIKEVVKRLKAM